MHISSDAIIVLEIFEIIICGIMLYGLIFETKVKNMQKTAFEHMVWLYFSILFIDVFYMILLEKTDKTFLMDVLFVVPLLFSILNFYVFLEYLRLVCDSKGIVNKIYFKIAKSVVVFSAAITFLFAITGNLCRYDGTTTELFWGYDVYLVALASVYALIAGFLVVYLRKLGRLSIVFGMFVLLPCIADLYEAVNDEWAFAYPVTVITLLIIYVMYQSQLHNESEMEKMNYFSSIAKIYHTLHVFDLENNELIEYGAINSSKKYYDEHIDNMGLQALIWGFMSTRLYEGHQQAIKEFTDLSTLEERMKGTNSMDIELLNKEKEWYRFSFIRIGKEEDGIKKIFFTSQNIDDNKRKEKKLLELSHTDELSHVHNRNAFEADASDYEEKGIPSDLWCISVDLNGLKIANDSFGHDIGDTLIIQTAECLHNAVSKYGKVYRIGGDEFVALMRGTKEDFNQVLNNIELYRKKYNGTSDVELSFSIGYSSSEEKTDLSFDQLMKIADDEMYELKDKFYKDRGINRGGQKIAYDIICNSYTKILKVNLTKDTYEIIKAEQSELTKEKGYEKTNISKWLYSFAMSGQVHPADKAYYIENTDLDYVRDFFKRGNNILVIRYRRKYGDEFKAAMMEIIPTSEYTEDNQIIFLYVKDIGN